MHWREAGFANLIHLNPSRWTLTRPEDPRPSVTGPHTTFTSLSLIETLTSLVESRHQVLRKAIDGFMTEIQGSTTDDIKKAFCYVVPQLNQSVTVRGFSPTQWGLGYQPCIPGLLMDEGLNPSHLEPSSDF